MEDYKLDVKIKEYNGNEYMVKVEDVLNRYVRWYGNVDEASAIDLLSVINKSVDKWEEQSERNWDLLTKICDEDAKTITG